MPDRQYEKLPEDIANRYVLLLDPMLGKSSSSTEMRFGRKS
jgi:uracil phosphoribosyltransferase